MAQHSTTYTALVARLQSFCEDDSTEFDSEVNAIINRAEERILRDLDLSIWNTVQSTTCTTSQAYLNRSVTDVPVTNVYFTAAGIHAEKRTREWIQAHAGSGRPLYYCDDYNKIHLAPTPDSSYAVEITHFVRPSPLSSGAPTNWLTTNVADLLLWASLAESESFLLAPERVQEFEQNYVKNLGPVRALWRKNMQTDYEPVNPTPTPQQTR